VLARQQLKFAAANNPLTPLSSRPAASSPDERSEIRDKRSSPQTAPEFHFVHPGYAC
jgi:hypothetical protein